MWEPFCPGFVFLQIPVFQRGGTVIPLKTSAGKSTEWMIDISYELHVALDAEVCRDSIPFLQRCLLLHLTFVGPVWSAQWHLHLSAQWLFSICAEGDSDVSPTKRDYLSTAEPEYFSDFFQPLSSPLEGGAENEQATNFLLDTERELPTTVFANKEVTYATCINLQNQDVWQSQSWIAWAFQWYKLLKKNKYIPSIWSITYSETV